MEYNYGLYSTIRNGENQNDYQSTAASAICLTQRKCSAVDMNKEAIFIPVGLGR